MNNATQLTQTKDVLGVLLAGGQSRRMGKPDKCLMELGGRSLLARAIERGRLNVGELILNTDGAGERFSNFNLVVVPDDIGEYAGPLAGVLSAMEWAAVNRADVQWVATFAIDAPFFPPDMVARLKAAIDEQDAEIACAASNGRRHPVFALWPVRLAGDLRRDMSEEGVRKVGEWMARYKLATVDFSEPGGQPDPFFNINTPEDLAEAEKVLSAT